MKARILAELTRRARQLWPEDETRTELDYVASYQASGGKLTTLSAELDCSPAFLRETMRVKFGAETVRETLTRAREEGAHTFAEDADDIASQATPDNVHVARLQVQSKQWLSEKWNRREFGNERAGVQLSVSIGSLMLDALRQAPPIDAPAIIDAIAEPAEILSIESATSYESAQRIPNPPAATDDQLTLEIAS